MNILHICKKYPDALGGDTVVVSNLQKQQEAAGHTVSILTSNCADIRRGPRIYFFGLQDTAAALDRITLRRLLSLVALFFKAFTVVRRERPDVIHAHSVDMAFLASFAARWFGVPMIHTFHIVLHYDPAQSLLRRKTEVWLAKASGARIVTAPNAHDVTKLREAGLAQATVLPNGIDMAFWRPHTANALSAAVPTFVSVGRLESQKGYEYLIRAAAIVAGEYGRNFKVVIVGEGSARQPLETLASSLDVSDIVRFVGSQTPVVVRDLLASSRAAVFTSLYETTPLTLLEAWAMGVPVIATEVGILRDGQHRDAVRLVPCKDAPALADALFAGLRSADGRQARIEAGQRAAALYTWPGIARHAESLYGAVA